MKHAMLMLALVLAACQLEHKGDEYPVGQGGVGPIAEGGGDGGTNTGDAGVDGDLQIKGRVCVIDDLRFPTRCNDNANAMGLNVRLGTTAMGSQTATTTNALGNFTITAPLGGGYTWRVDSGNQQRIAPTVMAFGTEPVIPVVLLERYNELLNTNDRRVLTGQGSIVVRIVNGTMPVNSITAAPINGVVDPRYDDGNAQLWADDVAGTGTAGGVWFAGVPVATPAAPVTMTLRRPSPAAAVTAQGLVEDQAITFVTKDLRSP